MKCINGIYYIVNVGKEFHIRFTEMDAIKRAKGLCEIQGGEWHVLKAFNRYSKEDGEIIIKDL